jgi:predicted P-loop ATPase
VSTQQAFGCGYIPEFKYGRDENTSTPAIIVPTSDNSFMWRSTTENLKRKRGTAHILNPKDLRQPYCFVVEGEIDCMSVHECGMNCIGLGSTSNINKIFNYDTSKTTLILALDNDSAGQDATQKLAELCEKHRTAYVVASPDVWGDCKDANELLTTDKNTLISNLNDEVNKALSFNQEAYLKQLEKLNEGNSSWKHKLKRNRKDKSVKNNLTNLDLILENDEKYKDKIEFNELTQMITYNRENWCDAAESRLKFYLEKEYDLVTSVDNINHICNIVSEDHSYHPIKEYLESTSWDGTSRISTVFIDFLGSVDNVYTRSVAVVSFVGAVARVYNPGVKFDTCTVLVGKQGTNKSKFLSKMAVNPDWFTDGVVTFDGKDFYESIQGKWIIELGEGTAFQKSIKERTKQAIASQQDFYRKPYARNPEIRKRQCVFFGTTNNYDFLKDETGDRRYYPIDVNPQKATKSVDYDLNDEYIAQLWAEALFMFQQGENIYIQDRNVLDLAEQEQRKHFDESPLQSDIYNFLEILLPRDWYSMNLESRRIYIRAVQNGEDTSRSLGRAGAYRRDKVSVKEILCELYGYELNQTIDRKTSLDVGRSLTALGWNKTGKAEWIKPYGTLKTFYKN